MGAGPELTPETPSTTAKLYKNSLRIASVFVLFIYDRKSLFSYIGKWFGFIRFSGAFQ